MLQITQSFGKLEPGFIDEVIVFVVRLSLYDTVLFRSCDLIHDMVCSNVGYLAGLHTTVGCLSIFKCSYS